MLIGRFAVILPCLVIAGSLASKKTSPPSAGTFATDSSTFAVLLIGVIIIVGALTFLPALGLGPIVEHFQWRRTGLLRSHMTKSSTASFDRALLGPAIKDSFREASPKN